MSEPLTIDIWSDIACPWCWVGKRNLEGALEELGVHTHVRWHAFELNPHASKIAPEQIDYAERLAKKYRTTHDGGQAMVDRMVDFGRDAGLELRFDRIRPSNTFDAHRLVAWAGQSGRATEMAGHATEMPGHATEMPGRATEMKERLFTAYLHEGLSISDHDQLAKLAAEVGLDRNGALAVLSGDEFSDQVRSDEMAAQKMGVSGVPFFLIAGQLALPGAQPIPVLLDALRQSLSPSDQRDS